MTLSLDPEKRQKQLEALRPRWRKNLKRLYELRGLPDGIRHQGDANVKTGLIHDLAEKSTAFLNPTGYPSHCRWHVNRGMVSPSCDFCNGAPPPDVKKALEKYYPPKPVDPDKRKAGGVARAAKLPKEIQILISRWAVHTRKHCSENCIFCRNGKTYQQLRNEFLVTKPEKSSEIENGETQGVQQ